MSTKIPTLGNISKNPEFARVMPYILLVRSLLDGNINTLFGLKYSEIFGIILFSISVFLIIIAAIHLSPIFIFLTVLIMLSSLQGYYNWGDAAFAETIRTVGIFGIIVLAWRSHDIEIQKKFYKFLKIISATNGMLILCQVTFLGGGVSVSNVTRYSGFMYSANTAAILCCCYLLSEVNNLQSTNIYSKLTAIVFSLIGLYFTYSFSGFIFLIFGLYFTIMLSSEKRFTKLWKLTFFVFITATIAISYTSGLRNKYFVVVQPVLDGNASGRSSIQWRIDAWKEFWPYFIENPLFGQGFGATKNFNLAGIFMPHNEFLRFLVEVGILGTSVFILIYSAIIIRLRRNWHLDKQPVTRYALVLLFAWVTSSISENSFTYTVPQYVLGASIGFALGTEKSKSNMYRPYRISSQDIPK